jgi:hypothetical protein
MLPRIHIYPLSRIVHAPAGDWESLLKSIESGKQVAFGYYLPMREASVKYCRAKGKGRQQIVQEMLARSIFIGGSRGSRLAKANESAFSVFEAAFYPRTKRFRRDLLRVPQQGCKFEGLEVVGSPHMIVVDQDDRERFVHLHASDWPDEQLKAYLELLSIIVEQRYSRDPESIWCMNLRTGQDDRWRPRGRIRSKCGKAARLLARFLTARSPD